MISGPLNETGAAEAAAAISAGAQSAEQLVRSCLDRIEEREPLVGAWACVNPSQALADARARDLEQPRSRLHGIPVGLKDIIDTAALPTSHGSEIFADCQPRFDASCATLLQSAGMIILGKTVTTEFALREPGRTKNPHNPAYTPGGSSSGSAAAVADFMVPLAVGTQTGGSVIRPASYCGVVGYKPTFGLINRRGVRTLSESLDTIGLFSRNVRDAAIFADALAGTPLAGGEPDRDRPLRIGLFPTSEWHRAHASTHRAIEFAKERLAAEGFPISILEAPLELDAFLSVYSAIQGYEIWRSLASEVDRHADKLSRTLQQNLEKGRLISLDDYRRAQSVVQRYKGFFETALERFDLLLTPSATGDAPLGHGDLGDSAFNCLWTLAGLPCMTLPCITSERGLPVGIQIVGAAWQDGKFLHDAARVEKAIGKLAPSASARMSDQD